MSRNKKTKRFYVYKLIDPKTALPFYIGKGQGDRIRHHEQQKDQWPKKATHKNMFLKNKIKKVLKESGYIRYQKHFTRDERVAFELEVALIKRYGRRDNKTGILCNMTDGGEGVSGYERSEIWRQKQREKRLGSGRDIDRYTMNGQYVDTWKISDIISQLHLDSGSISMCCNNKARSSGGFRWVWKGEPLQDWETVKKERLQHKQHKQHKPHKQHKGKTVYQFTLAGEMVASFSSLVEAGRAIDKHANTILECCKGRSNHAGGFRWSYNSSINRKELTIFQYDGNGNYVNGFVTTAEAEKQTGVSVEYITAAVRNPTQKRGEFYWRDQYFPSINPHIKKTTGKKVFQCDASGSVIAVYLSVRQAKSLTGIKGISNCLCGLAKSAGGYFWKYAS